VCSHACAAAPHHTAPHHPRGNNEEFLSRTVKYAQRKKWSHLLAAYKTALAKLKLDVPAAAASLAPGSDTPAAAAAAAAAGRSASPPVQQQEAIGQVLDAVEAGGTDGSRQAVGSKGTRSEAGGSPGGGGGSSTKPRKKRKVTPPGDAAAAAAAAAGDTAPAAPQKRSGRKTGKAGTEGAGHAAAAASAAAGQPDATAAAPTVAAAARLAPELLHEWQRFAADVAAAERAAAAAEGGFAFAFVEGALVKALRHGWWLLLDEVNLAPPEVLERIAGILEAAAVRSSSSSSSAGGAAGTAGAAASGPASAAAPGAAGGDDASSGLLLLERGDVAVIPRHPGFRLVAAMNPATDAGKRDLPPQLRSRFTEFWVGEPRSVQDLAQLVGGYLAGAGPAPPVDAVVAFYSAAKAEAVSRCLVVCARCWVHARVLCRRLDCRCRCQRHPHLDCPRHTPARATRRHHRRRASPMAPATAPPTPCARCAARWTMRAARRQLTA
jgi:hypothetical protein